MLFKRHVRGKRSFDPELNGDDSSNDQVGGVMYLDVGNIDEYKSNIET